MKPGERDDLLIRLDERTQNTWRVTEKMEKHLAQINGQLVWIKVFKWGAGLAVIAIGSLWSRVQGLW